MGGGESTEAANKQPNRPMTSQFIRQTNQKEKEASKLKIDKRTNKTNKKQRPLDQGKYINRGRQMERKQEWKRG